jgi:hypothetical protein
MEYLEGDGKRGCSRKRWLEVGGSWRAKVAAPENKMLAFTKKEVFSLAKRSAPSLFDAVI